MRKKLSIILLVLLILIQLSPLQVNASTVSNELKISSELTEWVLDEPTNTLYAISESGKNLIFINATTMNIEKNLTLNGRPTDIIKDNGKLYIALDELNQIVTVDMAGKEVTETLHTSSDPYRIEKDGDYIFYTERDQWCNIYVYSLIENTDEKVFWNTLFYQPDLAINTKDHILYIGESGLSVSNMTYFSTVGQGIISKTNYDPALGFPYPERSTIFDGEKVYYAGLGFNKQDPTQTLGSYGKNDIIFAKYGSLYTKTSIYDSKSHSLIEDNSNNSNLIEISDNLVMFYYSETDNSIYANWTYAASVPVNGWSYFQRKWYFFNNKTMVINSWKQDSSKRWFYLGSDGVMVANTWRQDSSKDWFYLGDDGAMAVDTWKQDSSSRWYYLGTDGAMVTNTWKQDSSKWYYLGDAGAMVANTWILNNGKWYYLKENGEMSTGWMLYKGNWYYLYSSGEMASNTIIDGYRINGSGIWIR